MRISFIVLIVMLAAIAFIGFRTYQWILKGKLVQTALLNAVTFKPLSA